MKRNKQDFLAILVIGLVLAVSFTVLANRGFLGWFGTQGNGWLVFRSAVAGAIAWVLVKGWGLTKRPSTSA